MIKTILFSAFMALGTFLIANGDPVVRTAKVDVESSTVEWTGKKVTGQHEGTIAIKSGELEFDSNGNLASGNIVVDMTSITCTDLKGGGAGKLVGHLSSDDFFGVDKHPEASLTIDSAIESGDGNYDITGELTIKGITKPISFSSKMMSNTFTSEIVIERTQYGVRYGSGSFFDNLGDKTIDDEFTLNVSLVLAK